MRVVVRIRGHERPSENNSDAVARRSRRADAPSTVAVGWEHAEPKLDREDAESGGV